MNNNLVFSCSMLPIPEDIQKIIHNMVKPLNCKDCKDMIEAECNAKYVKYKEANLCESCYENYEECEECEEAFSYDDRGEVEMYREQFICSACFEELYDYDSDSDSDSDSD